mgnify:CR=1 FL=1
MRQNEGVVIGAMAEEKDPRVSEGFYRFAECWDVREIDHIARAHAEQRPLEFDAALEVRDIEAEMAKPSYLEGARVDHPADIVAFSHGASSREASLLVPRGWRRCHLVGRQHSGRRDATIGA